MPDFLAEDFAVCLLNALNSDGEGGHLIGHRCRFKNLIQPVFDFVLLISDQQMGDTRLDGPCIHFFPNLLSQVFQMVNLGRVGVHSKLQDGLG